jgi:glucokinase
MKHDVLYTAVDLGAGQGAKIGIFKDSDTQLAETILPCDQYGKTCDDLANGILQKVNEELDKIKQDFSSIRSFGIASAGILKSDGTFHLTQNLIHLVGSNLPKTLKGKTGLPALIENDANAGGLAEWSVLRVELLYWVLGGGWGGAWISRDGKIKFPTVDWDGNDSSLHYTNEPGYGIPIEKSVLKILFASMGVSYERFEKILIEDLDLDGEIIGGPSESPDHLRAEAILSGPGRCRLFRAIVADDDFYERFLDIHESKQMSDPAIAGKVISKLSSMRVEAAVQTDRLFGKILAVATKVIMKQAKKDGLPEDIPICLGGKPSYALPYFGPSAQRAFGKSGIMSYLRPSVIDERGHNANLVGAAVLAEQALAESE